MNGQRRLIAQRLVHALEDGIEFVYADELLRERDVRRMLRVEPQALRLAGRQRRAHVHGLLPDVRRRQNRDVKGQEVGHHSANPNERFGI